MQLRYEKVYVKMLMNKVQADYQAKYFDILKKK